MADKAEQGHTALLERLAAMTRRELLAHCKTIIALAPAGGTVGFDEPDIASPPTTTGAAMPIETCNKQLAGRDPCQLPENHEGDCDHNRSASTASRMAAAQLVEAKNLRSLLHGNQ